MLSINYYTKGSFAGKTTDKYISAMQCYSNNISKLSGEQLNYLHSFCNEYNNRVLREIKEGLLRSVAIDWSIYELGNKDTKPLKTMSKKELKTKYSKHVVKVICKCKKIKIKKIHANILLGNLDRFDSTDLGPTEKQLSSKRALNYAGSYVLSIFLLSLLGVKDVVQWGWMGAFLTLFKVTYIAIGAYTKYFNGYEDITNFVVNHLYRKTDILKEFEYWYANVKQKEQVNIE
jgi:hypothetical protein